MPKTIKSKFLQQQFPQSLICKKDKTNTVTGADYYKQRTTTTQTASQKKLVLSKIISDNARCNQAVGLAEKEWDPKKIYETNGENSGADIIRYRYGVDNNFAWCASFFNYLYNPDHISGQNVLGMSDKDVMSTQKILKCAKEVGCFASAKSGYKPQVGDALIWKNNQDENKGHIGIIVEVRNDGSFVTIQGNNNNKVEKIEYSSIDDAMLRISSSGSSQSLQGFVQMSKYNNRHNLAEERTTANDSLISSDATGCWMS